MTHLRKLLFFSFTFMLFLGLSHPGAHAQIQDQMNQMEIYKLVGKVVDANTGEALSDVDIEMSNPDVESAARRIQQDTGGIVTETTNDQGEFAFNELPAGEYIIRINHDAYEMWERNVNLRQDSQLTISLQPNK